MVRAASKSSSCPMSAWNGTERKKKKGEKRRRWGETAFLFRKAKRKVYPPQRTMLLSRCNIYFSCRSLFYASFFVCFLLLYLPPSMCFSFVRFRSQCFIFLLLSSFWFSATASTSKSSVPTSTSCLISLVCHSLLSTCLLFTRLSFYRLFRRFFPPQLSFLALIYQSAATSICLSVCLSVCLYRLLCWQQHSTILYQRTM